MSNKIQTAVEWLQIKMATSSSEEMVGNINVWFAEAKKMEKEQIEDSYIIGSYDMANKEFRPFQYYNEIYGGNNE